MTTEELVNEIKAAAGSADSDPVKPETLARWAREVPRVVAAELEGMATFLDTEFSGEPGNGMGHEAGQRYSARWLRNKAAQIRWGKFD